MSVLYELESASGGRDSLFSWRTRMALASKAAFAFSGAKSVPVIRDGKTVVRDAAAA